MANVKFCKECDSLFFIQHNDDTNSLNYICRNCGNTELCNHHLIHEQDYSKNHKLSYVEQILKFNPDLVNDPSIPKLHDIECEKCKETRSGKGDYKHKIAFIKYDDTNLAYMYICCHCKNYWINTN